jgi:phage shock protein C
VQPRAPPARRMRMQELQRLHRSQHEKMLAGVAGGLAEYLYVDPTWIRLGWVAAFLLTGPVALIAYLACWLIVPPAPYENPS